MRKDRVLATLFPAVRSGVLTATLTQPEKWWYLSELAQFLRTTPSSLQRELKALVTVGVLEQRREGTRVYVKAETRSPFFPELRALIEKTAGLLPTLQQVLEPFGDRIDCAFVYGSVARSHERALSDVDLLVIGGVGLAELAPVLRKAERLLGREVNVTNYSAREFRSSSRKDHFLAEVLRSPKEFVKGTQRDLDEIVGKSRRSRHKTSKRELDDMRALIARDLSDAMVTGLSTDRRFATAYNAALLATNMTIACSGYRVTAKTGHHRISFDCSQLALGVGAAKYADYFETCRRKRNIIDYTRARVVTKTEAEEIVQKAAEFHEFIEAWIDSNFPQLRRTS